MPDSAGGIVERLNAAALRSDELSARSDHMAATGTVAQTLAWQYQARKQRENTVLLRQAATEIDRLTAALREIRDDVHPGGNAHELCRRIADDALGGDGRYCKRAAISPPDGQETS